MPRLSVLAVARPAAIVSMPQLRFIQARRRALLQCGRAAGKSTGCGQRWFLSWAVVATLLLAFSAWGQVSAVNSLMASHCRIVSWPTGSTPTSTPPRRPWMRPRSSNIAMTRTSPFHFSFSPLLERVPSPIHLLWGGASRRLGISYANASRAPLISAVSPLRAMGTWRRDALHLPDDGNRETIR